MISERQQEANRRNAAKSHGPTTPEGRAAVRHNALKHGFTAAEIILPTVEEQIDFQQFRLAFEEEYKPVGPTEEILVEDIVTARWRLNRLRKMEPGFFALRREVLADSLKEGFYTLDPRAQLALIVLDDARDSDTYGKMSRYEGRFERTFHKSLKELQRLQALRAELSDSGNGTVSPTPISPDPDPPPAPISDPEPAPEPVSDPLPDLPSAKDPTEPPEMTPEPVAETTEIRNPTSEILPHPSQC